jgi:uncharacterized membrane protein YfcA
MVDWYFYPLMIVAGFAAGFINTLAGSGSILTLPLLIFMGLPANVANATNRVNVLFQNAVSTTSFHRSRVLDVRGAIILGVPAVIGSIGGALIAASLNEQVMRKAIGVVMIMMAVLIVTKSDQWINGRITEISHRPDWKLMVIMFMLGVYGGFIQLGAGVFILASLVMGVGYDLVRANAVKTAIILVITVAALLVFQGSGKVNWSLGLVVAIGSMSGAWVAARFAIHWGTKWVYRILLFVVILSALDFLGITALIIKLISG